MLYRLHEYNRALFAPAVQLAEAGARMFSATGKLARPAARAPATSPPATSCSTGWARPTRSRSSAFTRSTVDGARVPVIEQTVLAKPFCRLLRFKRYSDQADVVAELKSDPAVLVVAPLSGHHATLLRDTVRTLLVDHKVYVTDWIDARDIPADRGPFTLDDYVGYIREFIRHIGAERLHVIAVCQPAVPVLAATALMAAAGEPQPRSLIMMGGSIDARRSPTRGQRVRHRPLDRAGSRRNLIHEVPEAYPGRGRRVYPGLPAARRLHGHEPGAPHRLALGLLPAPGRRGTSTAPRSTAASTTSTTPCSTCRPSTTSTASASCSRSTCCRAGSGTSPAQRVAPEAIDHAALLTIEGELDDISGHRPDARGARSLHRHPRRPQAPPDRSTGAGHYGIFSGRRWRETVYPAGARLHRRRRRRRRLTGGDRPPDVDHEQRDRQIVEQGRARMRRPELIGRPAEEGGREE